MSKKILPQEVLKLIACITMLIDHFGAAIVPELSIPYRVELYNILRIIGRISFPIYCFLLVEGMRHTRNPYKYILRLAAGILLAEIPFDFALFGGWTWEHQSVMVTLTLGALMILCMNKTENQLLKLLIILVFALGAWALRCDYGLWGILMINTFVMAQTPLLQMACLLLIDWLIPSRHIPVFGIQMSIQHFAVFSMVPICLYSGRKLSHNRALQWGFYLFYPVHLLLLWMILIVLR